MAYGVTAVGAVCGHTGLVDPGAGAGPTMEVVNTATTPTIVFASTVQPQPGSRSPGRPRALPHHGVSVDFEAPTRAA